MVRRVSLAVLLVALAAPSTLRAEYETTDVRVTAYTWAKVGVGAPATKVKGGGGVEVRGPIAIGDERTWGGLGVSLDVEALPDKGAFSFDSLDTWGSYAELSGFFTKRVGSRTTSTGRVTTSAIILGRSTFKAIDENTVGRRALRAYGVGTEFAFVNTAGDLSHVYAIYGRDEAVGERGWGQLQIGGSLQLKRPVRLVGRAGLGFGAASYEGRQSDYLTVGLGVNLTDLF